MPISSVVLVSDDLNAVARVESACRSAGLGFRRTSPLTQLPDRAPEHLLVLDLDQLGTTGLASIAGELDPERTLAYASHVDEEAMRAGGNLGIKTLPRGRFWRELPSLLADIKV